MLATQKFAHFLNNACTSRKAHFDTVINELTIMKNRKLSRFKSKVVKIFLKFITVHNIFQVLLCTGDEGIAAVFSIKSAIALSTACGARVGSCCDGSIIVPIPHRGITIMKRSHIDGRGPRSPEWEARGRRRGRGTTRRAISVRGGGGGERGRRAAQAISDCPTFVVANPQSPHRTHPPGTSQWTTNNRK